jgi:hypothetical protein
MGGRRVRLTTFQPSVTRLSRANVGASRRLTNLWSFTTCYKNSFIFNIEKVVYEYKLRGFSPQVNYTDRATAVYRRSKCQLLRIEDVAWSALRILTAVNLDFLDPEPLLFHSCSSSVNLTSLNGPRFRPNVSQKTF